MEVGALPSLVDFVGEERFGTVLVDPPWRFANRTGKVAPEHKRLARYNTMSLQEISAMPVPDVVLPQSHLYLWVPNALVLEGLEVMKRWGFRYKTNLVWYKVRKDGGPDGRGVGFYFRNVTELVLFGTRGRMRTLPPGRRQVNLFLERKREHSHKPDTLYEIAERCSPGPYLELFARYERPKWYQWSDEFCALPNAIMHTVDALDSAQHNANGPGKQAQWRIGDSGGRVSGRSPRKVNYPTRRERLSKRSSSAVHTDAPSWKS